MWKLRLVLLFWLNLSGIWGFMYPLTRSFRMHALSLTEKAKNEGAFDISKAEKEEVDQGLTHIKYNKYAPPSHVAAKMSQEEFRAYIYKEMKEAERKRRLEQGGAVGSQISDDYINSLGKKK